MQSMQPHQGRRLLASLSLSLGLVSLNVGAQDINSVQPFSRCPAGGFLLEGAAQDSRLLHVAGSDGHTTTLTTGFLTQFGLNGIGYNPLDRRIYGKRGPNNSPTFYALGANGTFAGPFTVAGMTGNQANNVGDGDGYLHVLGAGAGAAGIAGAGGVAVVDVTPSRPTFMTMVRTYVRTAAPEVGTALGVDMAYNARDGLFYSLRSSNGQIVTMDPVTGHVALFGTVSGAPGSYGAQYITIDQQLLVIDNASGDQLRIDLSDPSLPVSAAGNVGITNMSNTDGAACAQQRFFVEPQAVPTLAPVGLALLAGLLGAAGVATARRRGGAARKAVTR